MLTFPWETLFRLFVGAFFFVFGLNGFFKKIPIPPPEPEMGRFLAALESTGYLMTFVKIFEILAGALLLTNFFVLLALHILAPLIFVIVTSQWFLNRRNGLGISLITLIPYLILVFLHGSELWIY